MTITVLCKASTNIGLGHLIRSYSLINQITNQRNDVDLYYIIIGDQALQKLIRNPKIKLSIFSREEDVSEIPVSDVVILDMTDISEAVLERIQKSAGKTAILSPIFNQFGMVDYYFGRTKYLSFDPSRFPNLRIFSGLEYAIISENCKRIGAGTFEENLQSAHFPIGIIMGGGDATNKTLNVLKALKKCNVPATFWVMLGEGYKHSLDSLAEEIRKDTAHEIILAKTNISMWHILNNCVLCIVSGGITSFEAVYAGLPSINVFDSTSQRFLLQEIVEHQAAFDLGVYSEETLSEISALIEHLYSNKRELLHMHINTKSLLDNRAAERILNELTK